MVQVSGAGGLRLSRASAQPDRRTCRRPPRANGGHAVGLAHAGREGACLPTEPTGSGAAAAVPKLAPASRRLVTEMPGAACSPHSSRRSSIRPIHLGGPCGGRPYWSRIGSSYGYRGDAKSEGPQGRQVRGARGPDQADQPGSPIRPVRPVRPVKPVAQSDLAPRRGRRRRAVSAGRPGGSCGPGWDLWPGRDPPGPAGPGTTTVSCTPFGWRLKPGWRVLPAGVRPLGCRPDADAGIGHLVPVNRAVAPIVAAPPPPRTRCRRQPRRRRHLRARADRKRSADLEDEHGVRVPGRRASAPRSP